MTDPDLRRFQPRPCRICHAISKAKCLMCGQSWTLRKMDLNDYEIVQYDSWVAEIERLKRLHRQLITFNMRTTGCEATDKLIILHIGDYRLHITRKPGK